MKRETRNNGEDRIDWVERAHQLAVRTINMVDHLPRTHAAREVTSQIVRCAPSVVVNLEEAKGALTLPDTLHRTGISRKEARETRRWLLIIRDTGMLPSAKLSWLLQEADEIVAMLTAGCKRLQARIDEEKRRKQKDL